jgi:pseudouridine 5'-phosphatase
MIYRRFPPVRACIFDMDGLLIDSEDAYTLVTNTILNENGRPNIPWTIKAQLQGRPGPAAGKIFRAWAKLPISEEQFMQRQKELQAEAFTKCKPLPGAPELLKRLEKAHTKIPSFGRSPAGGGKKVRLALATSSHGRNYDIKTAHMKPLFRVFPDRLRVVGDDPRVPKGRGKPLPDIYLLALQCINERIDAEGSGERHVEPEECLVFEDSVPGVEAGRRAGMRVVWVPHPGLLDVYKDRVEEVLAGRTGEHKDDDLDSTSGQPLKGSPGEVGEIDDGWAERLESLEQFDYQKYGIDETELRFTSESGQPATPGTTDKELEEMTAMADGKVHSIAEGTPLTSPVPGLKESKV